MAVISLLSVWCLGDWRHWKLYHPAMLFMAVGNLLYQFFTTNYFLWRFKPDFYLNHTTTELIYTFITFPATALLFISRFPGKRRRQYIHITVWIAIYAIMEYVYMLADRIEYRHGWSLGWSVMFDCVMFPMLIFHHKHPLAAYGTSVIICVTLLWLFQVPVHVPTEQRTG
ncbi:CBO0543 family protein [Paenibacillus piri]|nr:CBO0543 family protein [Paenibacillus piri]